MDMFYKRKPALSIDGQCTRYAYVRWPELVVSLRKQLAQTSGRTVLTSRLEFFCQENGVVTNLVNIETQSPAHDPSKLVYETNIFFHETNIYNSETIVKMLEKIDSSRYDSA